MFLNPWYANLGKDGGDGDSSAVPTASPSTSEADSSACPSPRPDREAKHLQLQPGWSQHQNSDGRRFYCNHVKRTSSWLPPLENWKASSSLPYGWESAVDQDGKPYYINHLNRTTTYEDPRQEEELPPEPREVTLRRHPELGFGFVAGSEKPVIVRFVTDGGPSVDKLQPGDQIWRIDGEDVKMAPRDQVIQRVRSCQQEVTLVVCQPPLDNSARKSALLSAAKKQRLKSNPSRVRFAEGVVVNGHSNLSPFTCEESCVPFMPNVLKVFLENGQTKSFKYDASTTVEDVLESLQAKLGIRCIEHFSIVAEHVSALKRNRLTLLDGKETLARIAARPGARHLRCLFRVAFVPKDAYELLRKDSVAFEYLYVQCCTDVVQERFAPELKYDVALRLAALHIHQHALSNNLQCKITVKNIEREFGLERFVPVSLMESMKRKELRKLLAHFLKLNQNLVAPGQKQLTALQAKLHYLKIISELPSYGAKCFTTSIGDSNMETVVLVSPKFGISQINSLKSNMPVGLCEIADLSELEVTRENELSRRVELIFKDPDKERIVLSLDERDCSELVLVISGYYLLFTGRSLPVQQDKSTQLDDTAPPYHSSHLVCAEPWSYVTHDLDPQPRPVDLSLPPPYRPAPGLVNGHQSDAEEQGVEGAESPAANRNRLLALDRNMNKTSETNANLTEHGKMNGKPAGVVSEAVPPPADRAHLTEARNEEVIERLAGMRQLVADAENYLTTSGTSSLADPQPPDPELDDTASVRSALSKSESELTFGPLKHSDSLLLLSQTTKDRLDGVKAIRLPDMEPSESDTDSLSTPASSPARRPAQTQPAKPATGGASFGLHSPDTVSGENLKDVLQKLKGDDQLPGFAEGTLYLDPDIIDLTMIPPPITPDEDGPTRIPPELSTPPTPFADRQTLEAELQALERDVGDLDRIGELVRGSVGFSPDDSPSSGFGSQQTGSDIDSIIANLTLPPPPSELELIQSAASATDESPVVELTRDQIASYIIPPPPGGVAAAASTLATTGGSSHLDANPVPRVDEIRVGNSTAPRLAHGRVGAKIASLQQKLQSSQTNGPSQLAETFATDQNLERALEENARIFRTLERRPAAQPSPPPPPPKPGGRPPAISQLPPLPPKPSPLRPPSQEAGTPPGDSPPALPLRLRRRNPQRTLPTAPTSPKRPTARPAAPAPPDSPAARKPPPPPPPTERSPRRLPPPPPPLQTSSPRLPARGLSADSSFEQDSLETSCEDEELELELDQRAVFSRACERLGVMSGRLDDIASACALAHQAGGPERMDETKFQLAKEQVTNEARQFVTASKLFVKAATESGERLRTCLDTCMGLMEGTTAVTQLLANHTTAPLQTQNLVLKVKSVCDAYLLTVQSAAEASGNSLEHPSMSVLMKQATSLAAALTALMRTLRVFTP